MDRESVLAEWSKMVIDGELLCDKRIINDFRLLTANNFNYYANYQDYLFAQGMQNSVKTRRSKIIAFLKSISDCDFFNVTQKLIDDYFELYKHEKVSTNHSRVDYLSAFFLYFGMEQSVDIEKHRKAKEPPKPKTYYSAQQIAKAKNEYESIRNETKNAIDKVNKEKYRNATRKLFVLQMYFYTPFSIKEIGKWQKNDCQFDDDKLFFKDEEYSIPRSLLDLIEEMRTSGLYYDAHDVVSTHHQLRCDLEKYEMGEITSKGADDTRKRIFWSCPQCGRKFEAIADNWCVMRYTDENKEWVQNWVVCREYCANE